MSTTEDFKPYIKPYIFKPERAIWKRRRRTCRTTSSYGCMYCSGM